MSDDFATTAPAPATDADKLRYNAPALDKGLDILEVLSVSAHGYTLSQLAKVLGRSVNQIFRMVLVLQRRGYIQADAGDRYTLGLKLFRLAHRQPPLKRLLQTALPLLGELAERARQSCHLAVYQEGRVVVVAQADNPERWSFGLKVGAVMGLTDTSSGHVLLAWQSEAERARMLARHIKVEGELDIDPGHLLARLDEVRRHDCALMPSGQIQGVTNIAFPVWGAGKRVVAALNVPYIARIDSAPGPTVAEVKHMQTDICARLSVLLGADDEEV